MTSHSLPDDLRQWPDDPYRLLGVSKDVELEELRRCYTRLIRQYKPEHFPDHFQRIRRAYEMVRQLIEWREFNRSCNESHPDADVDASGHAPGTSPATESDEVRCRPRDEAEAAWEMACEGHCQEGYLQLARLYRRDRSAADVAARLYWLLRLFPRLDERVSARDVLTDGLLHSDFADMLCELYRREVARDPSEAMGPRFATLLTRADKASTLAWLFGLRWRAAVSLERPRVVLIDVAQYRERIASESDEIWAACLVTAIEQLDWLHPKEIRDFVAECRRELEEMTHLHRSLFPTLERLDLQRETVRAWRNLRSATTVPAELVQLLSDFSRLPFDDIRPSVTLWLERWVQHPYRLLQHLDILAQFGAVLVLHLENLLSTYQAWESLFDNQKIDDLDIREAWLNTFGKRGDQTYLGYRGQMLQFCMVEGISPESLANALESSSEARRTVDGYHVADLIRQDATVRCTYMAQHLFWSRRSI